MTRNDSWLENNWLKVGAVLLAALIIVPAVLNFWLAPVVFSENRDSGEEIARDSMDSDKAVQDYREFRRLWYDIQSHREQLEHYKQQDEQFHETWGDDPQEWPRDVRTRHGRIHDRITGERNQISNMVSRYNAKRADATQAIFTCGLPYSIDEKLYIADASGVEYTSQEAKSTTPPEDPSECKFSEAPEGASNTS